MNMTSAEKILSQAEVICQQRSVRLTPQRLEVLRLMSEENGAIRGSDLLDLLRASEPQAKPPTIYRALDFLLEQGFIHRVESTNSYVVCHHFEEPSHTSAMLICDRCGSVAEQHANGVEDILKSLALKSGFTLGHSVIEAHGFCEKWGEIVACIHQDACQDDHSVQSKKRGR